MTDKYQKIASILCELTDELLHNSEIKFNNTVLSNINLTTRIGGGLATYCKHDRKNSLYTITYGKKMIKSKLNQNELPHWLTYREILKSNYFSADTSIESVFAHTICHEFSHLLQQEFGQHKKGSVHNDYFYRILTYFHHSGHAEKIREKLVNACDKNNLSLNTEVKETIKTVVVEEFLFYVNDEISFQHKNKTYNGKVIKVNRKTIIVIVSSLLRTSRWKIPKSMANKCT